MAKKDMHIFTSKLRNSELNNLITRYNIPLELNPRLPDANFRMLDLPDHVIGVYTRIFDFSGVRIPFSSFLLAVLKHFKVHISQLVPLGLLKITTFEVLCLSRNIEPTVDLFRKFQTLSKQGDWFSFAKIRHVEHVCMDDSRSGLKEWKEKFFLIDRRAIPDYMPWRHPESSILDDLPIIHYSQEDVDRLCEHVVKLRRLPEGVLVLSGLSRVWKSKVCDPVLRRRDDTVMGIWDFMCMPLVDGSEVREEFHDQGTSILERVADRAVQPVPVGTAIPSPTPEELAATQANPKVIAKARSTAKRKASTWTEVTSNAIRRNRVDEEPAGAGSHEPPGEDELADEDTLHDDTGVVMDVHEHAEETPGGNGFPDVLHAENGSPSGTAGVDTEAAHGTAGDIHPAVEANDQVHDDIGDDVSLQADESDESDYGDLRSEFRYEPREGETTGAELEAEFLQAGPYYMPYPYDDSSTRQIPKYTRDEWDDVHAPCLGVLKKEIFKDPHACRDVAQRVITPAEALRVGNLTDDQLSDRMSVLTCLLLSHGTELTIRNASGSDEVKRLLARCQQQKILIDTQRADLKKQTHYTVSANKDVAKLTKKLEKYDHKSEKSKKYKAERDVVKREKAVAEAELIEIKSKLEAYEAEMRELRGDLHRCKDTIADRDRLIEKTRGAITSFFQGDFEVLVRRFLGSGEFHKVLSGATSVAVSAGFEGGLRVCRTDEEFSQITRKLSHFVPDAHKQLDDVVHALPEKPFPFFHKVCQHAGDSLSDIAQLEPEMVTSSGPIPPTVVTASGAPSVVTSTTKTFGYTSTPEHVKKKKASSIPGSAV